MGTTTNAAQSLADLYNTRHAQESNASSLTSSRNASSSSLADLYNKRHDAEERKNKTSSSSLADLYNQRYESEHKDQDDSVDEVLPRRHQTVKSRPKGHAANHPSASLSAPRTIFRALSIDDSDDEGTPEPKSLLPSESDELEDLEDDDQDENDMNFHSTPVSTSGCDRSQTRSESEVNFQESAEPVYVPRSSFPRRGALRSSATRLTMDSDDEMEPEMPQASGSSNLALARPHPSPSKLVVQSSEGASMDPQSGISTPPIPPHHRKGESVPQHLLASTQEEESLNSILAAESEVETSRAEHEGEPYASSHDVGTPDEVVIISDSSFGQPSGAYGSPRRQLDAASSAASTPERSLPEEADAVVLQSPSKQLRERIGSEQASSAENSRRASPSFGQPSSILGDMPPELDSGHVSDVDSDAPVITDARIAELRPGESSGAATESDSDAQRSRYPRRARNVTDYNVRRAFERYERAQEQESAPVQVNRPKKSLLPVVVASPEFFDALRSKKTSKTTDPGRKPPTFAEFLMSKTKPAPAAKGSTSAVPPLTRSAGPSSTLTEAQVQALLKPTIGPRPLFDITVNTQDRASLFQLKPSTRRWLGIKSSGPLEHDVDSSDDDGITSPPIPGSGTPIPLTFGSIISLHLRQEKLAPAELREMFDSLKGPSLIGRPKDATDYESASRRLRLGRAYKQHLPDTLRTFADMEHQEWVRLEEYLPEVRARVEEQKEREQGRIMVEVNSSDAIQTQYDHLGRKRVTTIRCATGGTLKVYFNTRESDSVVSEEESQGYRIVQTRSITRSPSLSRMGSAPVRHADSDDSVAEVENEGAEAQGDGAAGRADDDASSIGTPEPDLIPEPPTLPPKATHVQHPAKIVQSKAGQPPTLQQLFQRTGRAEAQSAVKENQAVSVQSSASSSKPKATASKGTRDLFSYFGTQSSASQPASKLTSASDSASTSKVASSSTAKPVTAVKRSTAPKPTPVVKSAPAVQKGKQRALDEVIKVWPVSSRSTNSEVEVVIDLTRSSSAAESAVSSKRPRSPSPLTVEAGKKKALVHGAGGASGVKKVVGLGDSGGSRVALSSKAEGKKREIQQQKTVLSRDVVNDMGFEQDDTIPVVDIPSIPRADLSAPKHKRPSDAALTFFTQNNPPPRKKATTLSHVQLPSTPPTSRQPSTSTSNRHIATSSKSDNSSKSRLPAPTPSPTRGGWKGISGWYTNTRDAFSPTPEDRFGKSHREIAKRQRQSKLDLLLSGKAKKHKRT